MARKQAGARRSAGRVDRIQFEIASPLPNLVQNLHVVNGRLTNVDPWVTRFQSEGVQLTRAEYARRLRRRKQELSARIARESRRQPASGVEAAARISPAEHVEDLRAKVGRAADTLVAGSCPTLVGYATPGPVTQRSNTGDSINHGSTVDHGYDDSRFASRGICQVHSQLVDAASIWRDDNPDYTSILYEVMWTLPSSVCASAVVDARIQSNAHLQFTNDADDGGCFQALCALVSGDEYGRGRVYRFKTSDLLMSGRYVSGEYDAPRFVLASRSVILKGYAPIVGFAFVIRLWAQDGPVGVIGQFNLNRVGTYPASSPPSLQYVLSPLEFNCFISTAVYQALGKGDDCPELTALRSFRDTYVRSRAGGEELIATYYRTAPAIMEKLLRRPDSRGILLVAYDRYLRRAVQDIADGRNESALERYTEMMRWLDAEVPG